MAAKKKAKKSAKKIIKKVEAVPSSYSTVCPGFATTTSGDKVIDYFSKVFGAKVKGKYAGPDGSIVHAELKIGDTVVMFGAPMDGKPYGFHGMIYVKDCDSVVAKAIQNGGTLKKPVEDQFYGDRAGTVVDPFDNEWFIATHKEDVPKKEMDRRMAAFMQGQPWKPST